MKKLSILAIVALIATVAVDVAGAPSETAAFYDAIRRGDLPTVERVLNSGLNVAALDYKSIEEMLKALPPKKASKVDLMIGFAVRNKPVSLERMDQYEVMAIAIREGKADELKSLIKEAGNINELTNVKGQTLLFYAFATRARPEILDALIKAGIDVNAIDWVQGNTAAHYVFLTGKPSWASSLEFSKKNGASFEIRNWEGMTVNDLLMTSVNERGITVDELLKRGVAREREKEGNR
jgi:ankyrin repeat protein